jgi:hypothetical protein
MPLHRLEVSGACAGIVSVRLRPGIVRAKSARTPRGLVAMTVLEPGSAAPRRRARVAAPAGSRTGTRAAPRCPQSVPSMILNPGKWPLSTCPARDSSSASENGFSSSTTVGSRLPWEAGTCHRAPGCPARPGPPNSPAEFHRKSTQSPFYPNGQCCLLSTTFKRESAQFQTPWFHLPRGISLPVTHGNASELAV